MTCDLTNTLTNKRINTSHLSDNKIFEYTELVNDIKILIGEFLSAQDLHNYLQINRSYAGLKYSVTLVQKYAEKRFPNAIKLLQPKVTESFHTAALQWQFFCVHQGRTHHGIQKTVNDAELLTSLQSFKPHEKSINTLVKGDGFYVASHDNCSICLWDFSINENPLIKTLSDVLQQGLVYQLKIANKKLYVCGAGKLRIWDLNNLENEPVSFEISRPKSVNYIEVWKNYLIIASSDKPAVQILDDQNKMTSLIIPEGIRSQDLKCLTENVILFDNNRTKTSCTAILRIEIDPVSKTLQLVKLPTPEIRTFRADVVNYMIHRGMLITLKRDNNNSYIADTWNLDTGNHLLSHASLKRPFIHDNELYFIKDQSIVIKDIYRGTVSKTIPYEGSPMDLDSSDILDGLVVNDTLAFNRYTKRVVSSDGKKISSKKRILLPNMLIQVPLKEPTTLEAYRF